MRCHLRCPLRSRPHPGPAGGSSWRRAPTGPTPGSSPRRRGTRGSAHPPTRAEAGPATGPHPNRAGGRSRSPRWVSPPGWTRPDRRCGRTRSRSDHRTGWPATRPRWRARTTGGKYRYVRPCGRSWASSPGPRAPAWMRATRETRSISTAWSRRPRSIDTHPAKSPSPRHSTPPPRRSHPRRGSRRCGPCYTNPGSRSPRARPEGLPPGPVAGSGGPIAMSRSDGGGRSGVMAAPSRSAIATPSFSACPSVSA